MIAALIGVGAFGGAVASAQSVTVCAEAHVTIAGETVVDQDQTCQTISPESLPTP
ncbi:MAG TPA: hypothetical protein VGB52_05290 [Actinomycetota bacterium]